MLRLADALIVSEARHKTIAGLAAIITVAFAGPTLAESETERIQQTEQPGSEIEIDVGGGGADIHRKGGGPLLGLGEGKLEADNPPLEPLDDPDMPVSPDAIDAELPGEGPESLSGPDDDDPLPY